MKRPLTLTLAFTLALLLLLAAVVVALNLRDEDPVDDALAGPARNDLVARGAYLARAGNCMGCHTARGGEPYAGGRGIDTPFGTVYTSNLTPDDATGIGLWNAGHFWRALHNGRSRDGRLLYPAFPYTNYTRVTREDADALHAYLRTLKPVAQANRPHALRWPYSTQAALAVWRALYFKPARGVDDPAQVPEWNRGAYLVQGLGHCNACHGRRNALGASGSALDLSGGLIPMQNWYAPSLADPHEAGVSAWTQDQVVALMKTGRNQRASVLGPMAEVVGSSTQYLSDVDLRAMAAYLQSLPPTSGKHDPGAGVAAPGTTAYDRGAKLYELHCASCHGERGEGAPGIYPALAGNRAVTMASPANLVRVVVEGGYAPSTAGNPRPYGMPPFGGTLADEDLAQLLSYLRGAWGNRGTAVSAVEVSRLREQR